MTFYYYQTEDWRGFSTRKEHKLPIMSDFCKWQKQRWIYVIL